MFELTSSQWSKRLGSTARRTTCKTIRVRFGGKDQFEEIFKRILKCPKKNISNVHKIVYIVDSSIQCISRFQNSTDTNPDSASLIHLLFESSYPLIQQQLRQISDFAIDSSSNFYHQMHTILNVCILMLICSFVCKDKSNIIPLERLI